MTESGEVPPVGGVGDELAKLLQALQEWAQDSSHEQADRAFAAGRGLLGGINEHVATGGRDCVYCPVCQVISAVRATSPEVKQHLSVAGSSLLQAIAGLMEARTSHGPDSGEDIERIDLDDGDWEDE